MAYQSDYLALSWSTSRGRDTYGYNICRLDSRLRKQRYRTCGGGYDMVGTVLGDYLENAFTPRLLEIKHRAGRIWSPLTGTVEPAHDSLYGMSYRADTGKLTLDGACGEDCIVRIAETIGVKLMPDRNKHGRRVGYFVVWDDEEEV